MCDSILYMKKKLKLTKKDRIKRQKLVLDLVKKVYISKQPDMQIDDFTIETIFPPTSNPLLRLWRFLFGSKYKRKIKTKLTI